MTQMHLGIKIAKNERQPSFLILDKLGYPKIQF